jgi:hypothetical protein
MSVKSAYQTLLAHVSSDEMERALANLTVTEKRLDDAERAHTAALREIYDEAEAFLGEDDESIAAIARRVLHAVNKEIRG